MHSLTLATVCVAATAIGLLVGRMTRGITIYGADNLYNIRVAAGAESWRWPSDMHRYGDGKTLMKDAVILLLAAMQRILGDRTSAYPLVVLCLVANAISAVLLFLITRNYWTTEVGLLIFALFITSFWPYLIALYGGHISTAQTFFLASVYFMQRAESGPNGLAWYFVSGVAVGVMLFSSASSRKYLPLVVGAFMYSQRKAVEQVWQVQGASVLLSDHFYELLMATTVVLTLGLVLRILRHRRLLRAVSVAVIVYVSASVALSRSPAFYLAQCSVVLGICATALLFTCPNPLSSLRRYMTYWNAGKYYGHFRVYGDYFARLGKPIKPDMRGAGPLWIWRYFWRIAPFHSAYYLLCLFVLPAALLVGRSHSNEFWSGVGIICFSLSPILLGEVTGSLQLGRTYFPALAGFLLLIAYAAFLVVQWLSPQTRSVFWLLCAVAVLVSAAWNLWVFLGDVWPTRMAPAWIWQRLEALGARRFSTYDTPYNTTLFYAVWQDLVRKYEVSFIKTLKEATDGYVIVPGTSAKAINMECHPYILEHGNFDEDPVLNLLLDSKTITKYAVASFKTLGSSRMWGHESEVVSYQDLILREIGAYDRWRARAWILDAGQLQAEAAVQK